MKGRFTVVNNENTLEITLVGGLDAGNATSLSDQLQVYKGKEIVRMVIFARDLAYIASAGIRVIIFAVQKILQPGSETYFIGGQSDVLSVLEMTGIDATLIIQDNYE